LRRERERGREGGREREGESEICTTKRKRKFDFRAAINIEEVLSLARVARFFLVQNTKTGKIYQITTNYTKCP
jgi:hypothetical protein